jgi:hypothetical protein
MLALWQHNRRDGSVRERIFSYVCRCSYDLVASAATGCHCKPPV